MKKNIVALLLSLTVFCSFALSGCTQPENENSSENSTGNIETTAGTENVPAVKEPSGAGTMEVQVSNQPVYEVETQELYAQRDENRIYGVIYIPQNAGDVMRAIIYSHGFGGSYRYGLQYAEAMAARGYVVYCFDFCGGSPGSRSDGSQYEMSIFTEQEDLEAVIAMMQDLEYVDNHNIFLLGSSQGGAVSAITAADNRDEIAGAAF